MSRKDYNTSTVEGAAAHARQSAEPYDKYADASTDDYDPPEPEETQLAPVDTYADLLAALIAMSDADLMLPATVYIDGTPYDVSGLIVFEGEVIPEAVQEGYPLIQVDW